MLVAPADGTYEFWLASDDDGALLVSDDAAGNGRRQITSVSGFTGSRRYDEQPTQRLLWVPLLRRAAAGGSSQPGEIHLELPDEGWGWIHLEAAKPHAGGDWTDSGRARDDRPLEQRAIGEVRSVPSPPELTALLHHHIDTFGSALDGRLFVGERAADHLPMFTVSRVCVRAREAVFGATAKRSPVAGRPYDLRHAAVSTWLHAGVPATQVAEWAGHSVEVLPKIYAKCVDGDADRHRPANR